MFLVLLLVCAHKVFSENVCRRAINNTWLPTRPGLMIRVIMYQVFICFLFLRDFFAIDTIGIIIQTAVLMMMYQVPNIVVKQEEQTPWCTNDHPPHVQQNSMSRARASGLLDWTTSGLLLNTFRKYTVYLYILWVTQLSYFVPLKTRSTRDRSIPPSLQRWVSIQTLDLTAAAIAASCRIILIAATNINIFVLCIFHPIFFLAPS